MERLKKTTSFQTSEMHVAVRVRPMNGLELQMGCEEAVEASKEFVVVRHPEAEILYAFDSVLRPVDSNPDVYDRVADPIVSSCMTGVNGAILAYGQTASGKTFCIQGSDTEPGIIQLAAQRVFERATVNGASFTITVTYLEVYLEKIRDLLCDDNYDLRIREDPTYGFFVENLQEVQVMSPEDVIDVFNEGQIRRHVAGTDMNEVSSRSHTVFSINVLGKESPQSPTVRSRLSLVDLAGSENIRSTNAEGERLKEGGQINKSLLALSMVISSLANNDPHVKFRDSKLTQILQPCLSGNCRSAIICCITPADLYVPDSTATLKFAASARKIQTKYSVNEVLETLRASKRESDNISDELRIQNEVARLEKGFANELTRIVQDLSAREARYLSVEQAMENLAIELDVKSKRAAELDSLVGSFKLRADEEIAALQKRMKAKDDSIEEAARLELEVGRLSGEVQRLSRQLEEKGSVLQSRSIEVESNVAQVSRLKQEADLLQKRVAEADSTAKQVKDLLKSTTSDLDKQKRLHSACQGAIDQARVEKKKAEEQLQVAQASLTEKDASLSKAQRQVETKRKEAESLKESLSTAQASLDTAQKLLDEEKHRLLKVRETVETEFKGKIVDLEQALVKEKETNGSHVDFLQLQLKEIEAERTRLLGIETSLTITITSLEAANDTLRSESENLGIKLSSSEAISAELRAEVLERTSAVTDLTAKLAHEVAEVNRVNEHLHQTRDELAHLSLTNDRVLAERNAFEEEIKSLNNRLSSLAQTEAELHSLRTLNASLDAQLTDMRVKDEAEMKSLRSELAAVNEHLSTVQDQLRSTESQLLSIEQDHAAKVSLANQTHAEAIKAIQSKHTEDIESVNAKAAAELESLRASHATEIEALKDELMAKDASYSNKLNEKEQAFEEAKATLQKEIHEMQSLFRHRTNEVEMLKVTLAEEMNESKAVINSKSDEIVSLTSALDSKECEVQALKAELDHVEAKHCDELTVVKTGLDQKSNEVDALTRILQEKESQIEGLQAEMAAKSGELEVKATEVSSVKASLVSRQEELESVHLTLQAKDEEIDQLMSRIVIQQGTHAELSMALDATKAALTDTKTALADTEVVILEKDATIQEMGKTVDRLKTDLAAMENELESVQSVSRDVAVKDSILAELRSELEERNLLLDVLQSTVSAKETTVDELKSTLDAVKATLRESEASLAAKSSTNESMSAVIQDQQVLTEKTGKELVEAKTKLDEYAQALEVSRREWEREIESLKSANLALKGLLDSAKAELQSTLESVTSERQQFRDSFAHLENQLAQLAKEKTDQEGKTVHIETENQEMTKQIILISSEKLGLEERFNALTVEKQEIENRLAESSREREQVSILLASTQAEANEMIAAMSVECDNLKAKLSDAQHVEEDLRSRMDEISQQESSELAAMNQRLMEETKEFAETLALMGLEKEDLSKELTQLREDFDDILAERSVANNELLELREELGIFRAKADAALEENAELSIELTKLREDSTSLEARLSEATRTAARYMEELSMVKGETDTQLRTLVDSQSRQVEELQRLAHELQTSEMERLALAETKMALDAAVAETSEELMRKKFALVETEQELAREKDRTGELLKAITDLKRRDFAMDMDLKKFKSESELQAQTLSLLLAEKERKTEELSSLDLEVSKLRNELRSLNELVLEKDDEIAKLREVLSIRLEAEEITRVASDLRTRTSLASTKAKELSVEKLKIERVTSQLLTNYSSTSSKDPMETVNEEDQELSTLNTTAMTNDDATRGETSLLLERKSSTPKGTSATMEKLVPPLPRSPQTSTRNFSAMTTTTRNLRDESLIDQGGFGIGRVGLSPIPCPRAFNRVDDVSLNSTSDLESSMSRIESPYHHGNSRLDWSFTDGASVTTALTLATRYPLTDDDDGESGFTISLRAGKRNDFDESRIRMSSSFQAMHPYDTPELKILSPAIPLSSVRRNISNDSRMTYSSPVIEEDESRFTVFSTPTVQRLATHVKSGLASRSPDRRALAERSLVTSLCKDVSGILTATSLGDNTAIPSGSTMRDLSILLHRVKRRLSAFEDVVVAQQGRIALLESTRKVRSVQNS